MKYNVIHELQSRGPVDQQEPVPLTDPILVGEEHVLRFYEPRNTAGGDEVMVYPAFEGGKQCWFVCRVWQSAPGYSCSGLTSEHTISLEEGIELLVSRGVFAFPSPEPPPDRGNDTSNRKFLKKFWVVPEHPRLGWGFITADTYNSTLENVLVVADEAKRDVPGLRDKDIRVVVFNNSFRKGVFGVQFRADRLPGDDYEELGDVDPLTVFN
jgi:hypothetical protein